jgi:hypothetical protein
MRRETREQASGVSRPRTLRGVQVRILWSRAETYDTAADEPTGQATTASAMPPMLPPMSAIQPEGVLFIALAFDGPIAWP